MKVRNKERTILRESGSRVRRADIGVRSSETHIKKGIAAGIKEEEPEKTKRRRCAKGISCQASDFSGSSESGNFPGAYWEKQNSVFIPNQERCTEIRYGKNGSCGKQQNTARKYESPVVRSYRIAGENSVFPGRISERIQREGIGNTVGRGIKGDSTAGRIQSETIDGKMKTAAVQGRVPGRRTAGRGVSFNGVRSIPGRGRNAGGKAGSAGGGAAVGKMTVKAAGTAAKATAEVAAGGATGGTYTVIKKVTAAIRLAKKAEEKIRDSLESTRIKKKMEEEPARQKNPVGKGTGLLVVGAGMVFILILINTIMISIFIAQSFLEEPTSAEQIIEVAKQELADKNIGGEKYKEWYGINGNWCAMFVSWCANECGLIDEGVFPKEASVASMRAWYEKKELYHKAEEYEPKAGDIIFFENSRSHTGLVIAYDEEKKIVVTIEGNTGRSETEIYHEGSRVQKKTYETLTNKFITGYASPAYPEEVIEIPEPFGTEYSYMGWQMITSPSSKQYKLRKDAGMNFDDDGFGKVGDRYVIACTLTFGSVGDYIDWTLENGEVIKTVVGDIKNQNDSGCNKWGHKNGLCVVEFVVDKASWYGSGNYPTDFHEEWDSRVVKAARTGNYWTEKEKEKEKEDEKAK